VELECEPNVLELGEIAIGEAAPFSAQVINRTSAPVSVRRVAAACACANTTMEKLALAPEESTVLKGVLSGGDAVGPFSRRVHLELDSGKLVTVLELRGTVVRKVRWTPETIVLRPDVIEDRSTEQEVVVTNDSSEPIRLAAAQVDDKDVTLELPRMDIPPGDSAPIKIRVSATSIRKLDVTARVLTSHRGSGGVLDLPVHVRPVYAVKVHPSAFHFGVIEKRDLLNRETLKVIMTGDVLDNFKFDTADDLPPYLELRGTLWQAPDIRMYEFAVNDAFPHIDLSATLVFRFSRRTAGKGVVIEVPISGFLMSSK
jgi:hypothetical protein